jgi:hypothetical protein
MAKLASTLRSLAVPLALAALAACSSATGDDGLPVAFTPIALHLAGSPAFTAGSSAAGTVTVYGTVGLGGCDVPQASARLEGTLLVVRVAMKEPSGNVACPDILQVIGYRAEVTALAPGTYHLRLEHANTIDVTDPGQPGTPLGDGVRLETNVTVQ